jgi:hypothetical protein
MFKYVRVYVCDVYTVCAYVYMCGSVCYVHMCVFMCLYVYVDMYVFNCIYVRVFV